MVRVARAGVRAELPGKGDGMRCERVQSALYARESSLLPWFEPSKLTKSANNDRNERYLHIAASVNRKMRRSVATDLRYTKL